MGLLRRKKTTSALPEGRLPTLGATAQRNAANAPTPPVVDPAIIDDLRSATEAAAAAADRAEALAEQAQRQALLATETARSVGDTLEESADDAVTADRLNALAAEIETLSALVRASITESREAKELVTSLDSRITQMGVELAHQIDELSGDVDALGAREPGDGVDAEVVADLKSGQVRLAQEQARYQIAFRDDLATLADEIRKRTPH